MHYDSTPNDARNGDAGRRYAHPVINMTNSAKAMHDDEIVAAAKYFAALPPKSFVRVVESATVP